MTFKWESWGGFAVALGIAVVAAFAVWVVVGLVTRVIRKRYPRIDQSLASPRKYLLLFASSLLLLGAVAVSWPEEKSHRIIVHVLIVLTILASAAFATSIVTALINQVTLRHPIQGDEDQETRRLHTQLSLIRGLVNAAIWLIAIGISFFTIPGAEAVGTSVLASAGVASVIVGVAAQSLLGNVFAGLQIALSGSIRVGDLVVAQGEQGRIEEISLTSVIMRTWDEKCLVLPTNYFTTTPFENWTKNSASLLGTVQLDVDWRVNPNHIRTQLERILENNKLWDGRSSSVVVEDATGGRVRIRVLLSAADASTLFDLRTQVREDLVAWVSTSSPESLPVWRHLQEPEQAESTLPKGT